VKGAAEPYKPLSLSQHFTAPDGFVGTMGWLCGYSADAPFLDGAVERFTQQTAGQRAQLGRVALAVMLDPGNAQIRPIDVPGVMHLPLKLAVGRPFLLLHAKVAVLGFRDIAQPNEWMLRLVVSTGNWTRGTVEESLDLAWSVEVTRSQIRGHPGDSADDCADIAAAWGMLVWLRGFFDTRALSAVPAGRADTESTVAADQLAKWLEKVRAAGRGIAPRFIDNREKSFLEQVPFLVKGASGRISRNYFCMGSGFFEGPGEGNPAPTVLRSIVKALKEKQLLTARPEIDVFVNPLACQGVASAVPALGELGWKVREAGCPAYFRSHRALHAKFLFSANYRENSASCNSAWLYIGSGNLTNAGFMQRIGRHTGNLEAGVVLYPERLRWKGGRSVPAEEVVTNMLPLQWDRDFNEQPGAVKPGDGMPEPEIAYSAAPIAYVAWSRQAGIGWLRAPGVDGKEMEILDAAGEPCTWHADNGFRWGDGSQPAQVHVRWAEGSHSRHGVVPVLDELGRMAATRLREIDIEEAWLQLANFPMPPDDDDIPDGDPGIDVGGLAEGESQSGGAAGAYPVRQIMMLIENIAVRQTAIPKSDWATWCMRLEQSLHQAASSSTLQAFKALGVNPLSPLWESPFRPSFAEAGEGDESARYEAALKRIEGAWGVGHLPPLGERV
jgi:hypothetical protein